MPASQWWYENHNSNGTEMRYKLSPSFIDRLGQELSQVDEELRLSGVGAKQRRGALEGHAASMQRTMTDAFEARKSRNSALAMVEDLTTDTLEAIIQGDAHLHAEAMAKGVKSSGISLPGILPGIGLPSLVERLVTLASGEGIDIDLEAIKEIAAKIKESQIVTDDDLLRMLKESSKKSAGPSGRSVRILGQKGSKLFRDHAPNVDDIKSKINSVMRKNDLGNPEDIDVVAEKELFVQVLENIGEKSTEDELVKLVKDYMTMREKAHVLKFNWDDWNKDDIEEVLGRLKRNGNDMAEALLHQDGVKRHKTAKERIIQMAEYEGRNGTVSKWDLTQVINEVAGLLLDGRNTGKEVIDEEILGLLNTLVDKRDKMEKRISTLLGEKFIEIWNDHPMLFVKLIDELVGREEIDDAEFKQIVNKHQGQMMKAEGAKAATKEKVRPMVPSRVDTVPEIKLIHKYNMKKWIDELKHKSVRLYWKILDDYGSKIKDERLVIEAYEEDGLMFTPKSIYCFWDDDTIRECFKLNPEENTSVLGFFVKPKLHEEIMEEILETSQTFGGRHGFRINGLQFASETRMPRWNRYLWRKFVTQGNLFELERLNKIIEKLQRNEQECKERQQQRNRRKKVSRKKRNELNNPIKEKNPEKPQRNVPITPNKTNQRQGQRRQRGA